MTIVKIIAVSAALFVAACQTDGDFAYLENADGSCKYGHMQFPADHFCAGKDGAAQVGTRK